MISEKELTGAERSGFGVDDWSVSAGWGRRVVAGLVSRRSIVVVVFWNPLSEEPTTLLTLADRSSGLLHVVHLVPDVSDTDFAEVSFGLDFRVKSMEGEEHHGDHHNCQHNNEDRGGDGPEGMLPGTLVFRSVVILAGFEFVVRALHGGREPTADFLGHPPFITSRDKGVSLFHFHF